MTPASKPRNSTLRSTSTPSERSLFVMIRSVSVWGMLTEKG
jgi:hypothetical protein